MTRARRSTGGDAQAVVDLARQLGAILPELGLSEVEVSWHGVQVKVVRAGTPAAPASASAPISPTPAVVGSGTMVTIEAPMVGTFYRSPSPTADPFVKEGDQVKEGQCLCIIEAMKLMNEIESKVAGRIVKILVENGQAVEYGQPLFLIDPAR